MKNDRNFAATVVLDRKDAMKNERTNNLDARLDAALRALPDKPVASNFTARVLQAVERNDGARPARGNYFSLFNWLPRTAVATLAVMFALLTYEVRTQARSTELAHSLAAFSQVAAMPSPDVLKDFETVRLLNPKPGADRELLALLQ